VPLRTSFITRAAKIGSTLCIGVVVFAFPCQPLALPALYAAHYCLAWYVDMVFNAYCSCALAMIALILPFANFVEVDLAAFCSFKISVAANSIAAHKCLSASIRAQTVLPFGRPPLLISRPSRVDASVTSVIVDASDAVALKLLSTKIDPGTELVSRDSFKRRRSS